MKKLPLVDMCIVAGTVLILLMFVALVLSIWTVEPAPRCEDMGNDFEQFETVCEMVPYTGTDPEGNIWFEIEEECHCARVILKRERLYNCLLYTSPSPRD